MNSDPRILRPPSTRMPSAVPSSGLPFFRKLSGVLGLAIFLLAIPLSAQQEGQIHSVRFSLIGLPPLEADDGDLTGVEDLTLYGIHFVSGGEEKNIDRIPIHSKTRQYHYRGEGPLVFYRYKANPAGPPTRQILASIALAPEWDNILVIIMPQRAGAPEGFGTYVVSDDSDSFPVNSMRMLNFSGSDLAWLLDKERERVPNRSSSMITLRIDSPRMIPLRLAALDAGSDEWKQTYATSLPFRGNQRFLCVVLPAGANTSRFHATPILINDAPTPEVEDAPDAEMIEEERVR